MDFLHLAFPVAARMDKKLMQSWAFLKPERAMEGKM